MEDHIKVILSLLLFKIMRFTNTLFYLVILIISNFHVQLATSQSIVKVSKEDFPEIITIEGEPILTYDYHHHFKIHLLDTLLLTTVNGGKNHYHVYHKDKLTYLGAVGVRGDGPDEWDIPSTTVGQFELTKEGIGLWNFNYLRGTFTLINLTKTLESGSPKPILNRRLRINTKVFPYYQLYMGDNNKIFASGWIFEENRSRLKFFDLESNQIGKTALFPTIRNSGNFPPEIMNSLYTASFGKHPTEDKFVQALFVYNRIDIFDGNLKVLKSIVDGENWKNDYYDGKEIDITINFISPRMNGFNGLALSNNFIFALEGKKNEGTDEEIENESFIRVYDWEGRPKAYLNVNHDLTGIAFDEKSGNLYATDYSHELVLRFNILEQVGKWSN